MIRRAVALVGLVAAMALTGCASDNLEEQYRNAQSEIVDLISERDTAIEQHADTRADLEAERARSAQLEREASQAIANEQAAIRRAQELQDRLDRQGGAASDPRLGAAEEKVAELNGKGYKAVVNQDGDVAIRLSSDVTFGSGKSELTKSGMDTLRRLAPELSSGDFASYAVRVEGHTDNEPLKKTKHIYGDNRGLGSARANAVTQFLEREMGIEPSRIEAVSLGENSPIAENSTKEGRAKNRRVEIVLVLPRNEVDRAAGK